MSYVLECIYYAYILYVLLQALSLNNSGNVLISPISLKIILALLYEGASGATRREIQTVLQFSSINQDVRRRFEQILDTLKVFFFAFKLLG